MKQNSCSVPKAFRNVIGDCTASFATSKQEEAAFGKALKPGVNASDPTYEAWVYQTDEGSIAYSGDIGSYPGNGYMITLGETRAESEAILADLKANKWIDEQTRAIMIDFTSYNGNVNLFNQIRFAFL